MFAGPILVILVLLLSTKDSVGTSILGFLMGYVPGSGEKLPWILLVYKNSAGDPDSAISRAKPLATGFAAVRAGLYLAFHHYRSRGQPA